MLDATVLFAGTGWPRWSYEILLHAANKDFRLVLSPLVIESAREHLLETLPSLVPSLENWLRGLEFELVPMPSAEQIAESQNLMRHKADIPVALSGINTKVDYFVTEDKDYTDEDETTAEVRKRLRVMRPVIFLREVMGWSSEDLEKIRHRDWTNEGK